jgi:hypothetical protein
MSEVHVTAIPTRNPDGYVIECCVCGPLAPVAGDDHDAARACVDHLMAHGVPIPPGYGVHIR